MVMLKRNGKVRLKDGFDDERRLSMLARKVEKELGVAGDDDD